METLELKISLKKSTIKNGIIEFRDEVNKLSYFRHEGDGDFIALPNLVNSFVYILIEGGIVMCHLKQESEEQKSAVAVYVIERREWVKDGNIFLFDEIRYDSKFVALKKTHQWKVWEIKTGERVTHTWTVVKDEFSDVDIKSHRVTLHSKPALEYMLE